MISFHTPRSIADIVGAADFLPGEAADRPIVRYVYDSRLVHGGAQALFVALAGPTRDGHAFLGDAFQRGVRAFLVREGTPVELPPAATLLRVADPLQALQQLAAFHRTQFRGPVVGITGSNGKTIVKEWLTRLLEREVLVWASPGSFNSQLGVPLALLGLHERHQVALIEAGISHPGEMGKLAAMIQPTLGVLTHFGDAHAENFPNRTARLAEKLQLFTSCTAVIASNQLPELGTQLQQPILHIGQGNTGHWVVEDATGTQNGWDFAVRVAADRTAFHLPVPGSAALENAALTIATANHLGLSMAKLPAAVAQLAPVELRAEWITANPEVTVLNDAYNADATSVRQALALLAADTSQHRKHVVLTDLARESADVTATQAELLREAVALFGREQVTLIGPRFQQLAVSSKNRVASYANVSELLSTFNYANYRNATVLLKGARKFGLERLVPFLTRTAAASALRVNLTALRHNLSVVRSHLPAETGVIAMLKAEAYGTGGWQVARSLAQEGIAMLGVAYTGEGIQLRERGLRVPILVLSPDPATLEHLPRYRLTPAVGNSDLLQQLAALNTPLALHLEFNTGMARLGFEPDEARSVLAQLSNAPQLTVSGVFSHLAAAEDPAHDAFTQQQLTTFGRIAEEIRAAHPAATRHVLNSGGILRWPSSAYEAVRPGLALYGLAPVPELQGALTEVAALHSQIVHVREAPAGTSVGYGRTVLTHPTRLATVPLGYADGLPRALGYGRGAALLHEQRCPIVGSVCMDLLMLDIGHLPQAQVGDEVVFFGRQGGAFQSVREVAEAAGTIPYEILVGISQRIRRLYTSET